MRTVREFKNKLLEYKTSGKTIEMSQTKDNETRVCLRKVGQVQSKKVSFILADGKESWLDFPSKNQVEFLDENTLRISGQGWSGQELLTYKFLD